MGTGKNGGWTFLDIVTLISFVIGLENLEYNITQDDLQDIAAQADKRQSQGIEDIHRHLAVQDEKLNLILEALKGGNYDSRRNL